MMPEQDSSPDSEMLARELCAKFGVEDLHLENLTPTLEGFQCYERRDEAVQRAFPEYDPATYKMKIGVKPELKVDHEGEEVLVPLNFPGGIKSLFIISDLSSELL